MPRPLPSSKHRPSKLHCSARPQGLSGPPTHKSYLPLIDLFDLGWFLRRLLSRTTTMCFTTTRPRSRGNVLYSFYASGILNIFILWSDLHHVMDYPTFKAKPDCREASGAFSQTDLFLYSHWKPGPHYTCSPCHTAAHDSHPGPQTWTYIVPQ